MTVGFINSAILATAGGWGVMQLTDSMPYCLLAAGITLARKLEADPDA